MRLTMWWYSNSRVCHKFHTILSYDLRIAVRMPVLQGGKSYSSSVTSWFDRPDCFFYFCTHVGLHLANLGKNKVRMAGHSEVLTAIDGRSSPLPIK